MWLAQLDRGTGRRYGGGALDAYVRLQDRLMDKVAMLLLAMVTDCCLFWRG